MFHVPLPFQLPLHEGFRYRWNDEDARQLEIVHYRDEGREPLVGEPIFEPAESAGADGIPKELIYSYTTVRIGMPVPLEETDRLNAFTAHPDVSSAASGFPPVAPAPVPEQTLEQLLEEGLLALNFLIRSLRIVTQDPFIYPIDGLTKLPSILLYTLWDIRGAWRLRFGKDLHTRTDVKEIGKGLFLVHFQVPYDREFIEDQQELWHVVGLASTALHGDPHPFFTSADLMRNAGLRLSGGDHNGAVTESITAVEVFAGTVVRLHLERQGRSKKQVDNVFRSGLKNMLRDHLCRMLGVAFDPENPGNPVEHWYASSYRLRGDVVHQGRLADASQAHLALAEAQEFTAYVRRQMQRNPSAFTHILNFLSGPSS